MVHLLVLYKDHHLKFSSYPQLQLQKPALLDMFPPSHFWKDKLQCLFQGYLNWHRRTGLLLPYQNSGTFYRTLYPVLHCSRSMLSLHLLQPSRPMHLSFPWHLLQQEYCSGHRVHHRRWQSNNRLRLKYSLWHWCNRSLQGDIFLLEFPVSQKHLVPGYLSYQSPQPGLQISPHCSLFHNPHMGSVHRLLQQIFQLHHQYLSR